MKRPANRARLRGHAETPYLICFFSIGGGLLWAAAYCGKHYQYTFWHKVGNFLLSPLVGLAGRVLFLMVFFIMGFTGDWIDDRINQRRRARSKADE